MKKYGPKKLPAYKLVSNTLSASAFDYSSDGRGNKMSKNMFSAYTWTGRPTSSHPLQTPILYHRGSWQAMNLEDPEVDPPTDIQPTFNFMKYAQYGTAWPTLIANHGVIKPPRCILYNYSITPAITASALYANPNTSYATAATYFSELSTQLAAQNVFTAALNDRRHVNNQQATAASFITVALPSYDVESDAAYTDAQTYNGTDGVGPAIGWDGITDYRRLIDETRFDGGHLLVLCGLQLNVDDAVTAYLKYTSITPPSSTTLGYFGNNTSRVDYDIGRLAACYPRFRSYTHIIYPRLNNTNATALAISTAADTFIRANIVAQMTAYGVTMKTAVNHDADIKSTVQADVLSWLAGLD